MKENETRVIWDGHVYAEYYCFKCGGLIVRHHDGTCNSCDRAIIGEIDYDINKEDEQ